MFEEFKEILNELSPEDRAAFLSRANNAVEDQGIGDSMEEGEVESLQGVVSGLDQNSLRQMMEFLVDEEVIRIEDDG